MGEIDAIRHKIKEAVVKVLSVGLHSSATDIASAVVKDIGGLDEKLVHYANIEVMNRLRAEDFKSVPKNERAVFIPHCLRNMKECRMPADEDGYHCLKCGKCIIGDIVRECDKNKTKWFIVGGGMQVIKLIEKHKPKAVLGIACFNELQMGAQKLDGGTRAQAILLRKDGCVNTDVDLEEVKEKINM